MARLHKAKESRQVTERVETIEACMFRMGSMDNWAVLVWAFLVTWVLGSSAYDPGETGTMVSLLSLLFLLDLGNILICCPPLAVLAVFGCFASYPQIILPEGNGLIEPALGFY
jgi:hypothetical protein